MRSRLFLVALALALAVGLFAVVWLQSRSVATERVGPTETPQSDARDAQPELARPLADPANGPRREAFEPADSALDRTYLPTEVALPAKAALLRSEVEVVALDDAGAEIEDFEVTFIEVPPWSDERWDSFVEIVGSRTVAPAVGQGAVADEVRVVRSSFYPNLQGSSEQHEREPTQSRWAFELAAGTVQRVQLLVRADGFESALVAFELAAGELRREVCVLQRLAVEISGVVCDERGRELAGLTLELRARSNVERERTTSDTDGRFSFPRTRKADAYALLVLDGDVLRASIEEGSLSLGMRVVVPTPARLSGQLLEPRGGLVGRARVQLSRSSENGTRTWFEPALVVEDGSFAFDPAPVGSLELNVWREREPGTWLHLLSSPLTLAAGEARELDVVVPALP